LIVDPKIIIQQIKDIIEQKFRIIQNQQILMFGSKILKNRKSMQFYSISDLSEIQLKIKINGGSEFQNDVSSEIESQTNSIVKIEDDGSETLDFTSEQHLFLVNFLNIFIGHENSIDQQLLLPPNSVIIIIPLTINSFCCRCFWYNTSYFEWYPNLYSFVHFSFPKTIESIGKCCFYKCSKLQSIELPESIKHLPS
jgi:hypothetical protein